MMAAIRLEVLPTNSPSVGSSNTFLDSDSRLLKTTYNTNCHNDYCGNTIFL